MHAMNFNEKETGIGLYNLDHFGMQPQCVIGKEKVTLHGAGRALNLRYSGNFRLFFGACYDKTCTWKSARPHFLLLRQKNCCV